MQKQIIRGQSTNSNLKILENNWNERFFLEKIPNYDSYKDTNILSLNLVKEKLKKEECYLKEFKKKIKKSQTNQSRLTLDNRSLKNLNIPSLISNTETEKLDLFSLKFNNNMPYITTGQNSIKAENSKKEIFKRMYNNIYDLKINKTEQNSKVNQMIDNFQKEVKEIKNLWNVLGIVPNYQNNFWKMLSKYKEKEIIDKFLSYEKSQLIQLKTDLEKLQKEISKRENDLNKLKQLDTQYGQNEIMFHKYNIKNPTGKDEEKNNKYQENKNKLENDIENLLKTLRLHTINTVSIFSKFRNEYNHYFTSGKININKMQNGYQFNNNYLIKIKSDTNFLINSFLRNIYNLSQFEDDPFFLSLLKKHEDQNNYKYLTATEDTINKIHQCMFIIEQDEILNKMNKKQTANKNPSFTKINHNLLGTNLRSEIKNLNRKKIQKFLLQKEKHFDSGKYSPLFSITLTEDFKNNQIKNNSNI